MEGMNNNSIIDELKLAGVRPSSARILTLKYLRENRNHPTIEQVYNGLLGSLPGLSRTSVYNTMNTLEGKGLVRTLSIDGAETRYDATVYNHGHFKCESCGAIFDFDTEGMESVRSIPPGFIPRRQDIIVRGLCKDCARKAKYRQ